MKLRHIAGIAVIVGFAIFSVFTYTESLTPYVTFAQAKEAKHAVQVRGVLANHQISTSENGKKLHFTLRDEAGAEVPVIYNGIRPDNFEHATSVVAIGKYQTNLFIAEKLLVKCPSKYQGSVKN